ncbi:hypothetical protein I545_1593 [Mycobacterium kansasii 662]|nr:hypothetical protein I545_1593 [Mycobacterium kansasii 662]
MASGRRSVAASSRASCVSPMSHLLASVNHVRQPMPHFCDRLSDVASGVVGSLAPVGLKHRRYDGY